MSPDRDQYVVTSNESVQLHMHRPVDPTNQTQSIF